MRGPDPLRDSILPNGSLSAAASAAPRVRTAASIQRQKFGLLSKVLAEGKMQIFLCQHGRRMLWNHVIFFFEDRMNHLESQQKYDKKRLSTHTVHLVEMEKSTSETMTTFDMCVLRLCFQDVENGGY